jgi:hypothetical protein
MRESLRLKANRKVWGPALAKPESLLPPFALETEKKLPAAFNTPQNHLCKQMKIKGKFGDFRVAVWHSECIRLDVPF